jgi:hypothetical protein
MQRGSSNLGLLTRVLTGNAAISFSGYGTSSFEKGVAHFLNFDLQVDDGSTVPKSQGTPLPRS